MLLFISCCCHDNVAVVYRCHDNVAAVDRCHNNGKLLAWSLLFLKKFSYLFLSETLNDPRRFKALVK